MICHWCGLDLYFCECYDPAETGQQLWTVEGECARGNHAYAGDDGAGPDAGRCYCGRRTYPTGGHEDDGSDEIQEAYEDAVPTTREEA